MKESSAAAAGTWRVPQCPFTIEYAPRALESVRQAVVDGFFALPRGGIEIGGVLLGEVRHDRVIIGDFALLECEHSFGPSFTLSAGDEERLADLLNELRNGPPERQPVGWYHSHTRSEIFLSDADLEVYQRFFPEPWQVALVLKPHSYEPTRAGFFFRQEDGNIQANSCYREFSLEALAPAATGESETAAAAPGVRPAPRVPAPLDELPAEPAPFPETEPRGDSDGTPIPRFLAQAEERPASPGRRWMWIVLAILAGVAIGGGAFETRAYWTGLWASMHAPARPPSIGLYVADNDGELLIRWNPATLPVENGVSGVLEILDGGSVPRIVPLDGTHLQSGSITYTRETAKVDVTLSVGQPGGRELREATTFFGKAPAAAAQADDTDLRSERDGLAIEVSKLKADVAAAEERNRRLERIVELRGLKTTTTKKSGKAK